MPLRKDFFEVASEVCGEEADARQSAIPREQEDRRQFLEKCGRFAVVTPPAVVALLSTSVSSDAIAASGGFIGPGRSAPASPRRSDRATDVLRKIFGSRD